MDVPLKSKIVLLTNYETYLFAKFIHLSCWFYLKGKITVWERALMLIKKNENLLEAFANKYVNIARYFA